MIIKPGIAYKAAQQKRLADEKIRAAATEKRRRDEQEKRRQESLKSIIASSRVSSTGGMFSASRGCPASHPIRMTFANESHCVSRSPISLSFGKGK